MLFRGLSPDGAALRWVDDRTYIEHGKLSAMVIITLGCAFVTQAIGVQAVFGAFSAGAMLGNGSARARVGRIATSSRR